MARLAGYGGSVYHADLLISNCEVKWDAATVNTNSQISGDCKVGAASASLNANSSVSGPQLMAFSTIAAVNVANYSQLMYWVKVNKIGVTVNGFAMLLANEPNLANAEVNCYLPAITANTWQYAKSPSTGAGSSFANGTAIISVGLKNMGGIPPLIIHLDDIRVARVIAGIKEWTLEEAADMLDVTGFDSGGSRQFIPGLKGFKGSISAFKTGAPLNIGEQTGIELRESNTSNQTWLASAIITDIKPKAANDGVIEYVYDIQGIDAVTPASA